MRSGAAHQNRRIVDPESSASGRKVPERQKQTGGTEPEINRNHQRLPNASADAHQLFQWLNRNRQKCR